MNNEELFDKLRQPVGHQARGCFNCKHNNNNSKLFTCAKNTLITRFLNNGCIAYYDRDYAELNLVNLAEFPHASRLWQKDWEWNGK